MFLCVFAGNKKLPGQARLNTQSEKLILSRAQALEDFRWLRFALEYVHPRLYKYEDKKIVDARFDSLSSKLKEQISGIDFLALVSVANASVCCGHLYTIPQNQLANEILNKKVFPFQIKILNEEIYILNDCNSHALPNGSKILSINGRSSRDILHLIMKGIAADGCIKTRKYRLMERLIYPLFQGFDLYYPLHVDRSDSFSMEYLPYGSKEIKKVTVKGMTLQEREKLLHEKYHVDVQDWLKSSSPVFKLNEKENYALLKVSRSFYDKNVDPDFDSLLQSAFHSIKEKQVTNLVLDLRNNEGGSEHQQMELMSYLYDQPFKLYQNIYLSHLDFRPLKPVIIERDAAELIFNNDDHYMRQVNDNLWINNYEYSDNLKLTPPKPDVFKGKLYVLMNGICFSSAADLIADIKKTREAIFIGEESGGSFDGPTGGSEIVIQLPNSKIMVRISPNIQVGYMNQQHLVGRGVLPDYYTRYTIEDIMAAKDLDMGIALSMIKKNAK